MSDSAGTHINWRPLSALDPRQLTEARLQAHYATQWLARTARGYIAAQPDDGHTNLGWDGSGFTTHAMPDGTRLHLNIPSLSLELRGKTNVQIFALDGHNDADVRQWLGHAFTARGLQADLLDAPSPYEVPAHAVAGGANYKAAGLTDALTELAGWFANADTSLREVRRNFSANKIKADEPRCWPHHFDLATLATFPIKNGETGYIGTGLSPGDHYYDEPYYYVSVYPKPGASALPALPKLGQWHTYEFTAAVTTARQILAAQQPQTETEAFLEVAVTQAIALLT